MTSVAVVGAGAAGLSAALTLARDGFDVRVFEATDAVGGRCRTIDRGPFRFDTGAGALPSTYTQVRELIDAVGMSSEIQERGAVIGTWRDGTVHRIHRRKPQTFLSARHLSGRSKLQLWRFGVDLARMYRSINPFDISAAGRFDDRSVGAWAEGRLSAELYEYFIAPLCRALFLVEPEETSVVAMFSAAKSLLVAGHLLTHSEGIGAFLERAAEKLDVTFGARVARVVDAGEVDVEWSDPSGAHVDRFDACVVALPGKAVLDVVPGLDGVRRTYLQRLRYGRAMVVHLGVCPRPAESSSMVLIPRSVEPALPVVGLGHNLAPGRAPDGKGTLVAFYMDTWSREHWEEPDSEIVEATKASIDRLFPGWVDEVEAAAVTRWNPAQVHATPGTYRDLAAFQAMCRPSDRIQLAGDYLAQTSVNASVAAGRRAASRLRELLRPT